MIETIITDCIDDLELIEALTKAKPKDIITELVHNHAIDCIKGYARAHGIEALKIALWEIGKGS